jgi:CspA family cold shock protein
MSTGIIIQFNDIIGKGFIQPDEGSDKISVSYREIKKSGYKILNEGQKVQFEMGKDKKGCITAVNVKLIRNYKR